MTHHIELASIRLESGGHTSRSEGTCLMEAVAWWAEEEHTDHPACVSPVIGEFGRTWNDDLDDATRQRLVPLIPKMVGTAGDVAADTRRGWMATDWLVRTFAPEWLRLAGLTKHADALAAIEELTAGDIVKRALPVVDAAGTAAGTAAGDAVDAAWTAAGAAAGNAAWTAAGTAAGDAAGDALKPTVAKLQDSAYALLERMCDYRTDTHEEAA